MKLEIVCSNRLSSALLHMIKYTFNPIGTANATGAAARCCLMFDAFDEIQPSEGRTEPADATWKVKTVSVEAQARMWYHNGQKEDKEYWLSKQVEVSMICCMLWYAKLQCRCRPAASPRQNSAARCHALP